MVCLPLAAISNDKYPKLLVLWRRTSLVSCDADLGEIFIDSIASRTTSTLNSLVYCRFGADLAGGLVHTVVATTAQRTLDAPPARGRRLVTPFKKPSGGELSDEERELNRQLSRVARQG